MRTRSMTRMVAVSAIAALALTACASKDDPATTSGAAAPGSTAAGSPSAGGSSSAGGGSGKTLIISTDLPLQGSSATQSDSTNKLIQLYLDQIGSKAGDYTIKLQPYDDSTAAKGAWDDAACAKNATDHVANADEVAVMGTFNSGCAKVELPTLNQANMLMVSHANTNPGLTKTWETGEPDKYYPGGKRTYARVVTTDDYQGTAAAAYAKNDAKITKCYVLNDNQTYGLGVAKAFTDAAKKQGIEIVGEASWDAKQTSYTSLFQAAKTAGADCVYLGGIYDNNGGQLVKDKVAVLGDNTKVKLMGPDGFTGYPDLLALPQAEGMFLTFAGLSIDQLIAKDGPGKTLIDAYTAKYGSAPVGSYPLYGVAAVQVILAAIAKSDGTRESVTAAVFGSEPITIPEADSVTGKEIQIDPKTGDTTARDITVEEVKGGKETFVKAQSVEG